MAPVSDQVTKCCHSHHAPSPECLECYWHHCSLLGWKRFCHQYVGAKTNTLNRSKDNKETHIIMQEITMKSTVREIERERERMNNFFFINEGKGRSTIYFFSSSPWAKTKTTTKIIEIKIIIKSKTHINSWERETDRQSKMKSMHVCIIYISDTERERNQRSGQ